MQKKICFVLAIVYFISNNLFAKECKQEFPNPKIETLLKPNITFETFLSTNAMSKFDVFYDTFYSLPYNKRVKYTLFLYTKPPVYKYITLNSNSKDDAKGHEQALPFLGYINRFDSISFEKNEKLLFFIFDLISMFYKEDFKKKYFSNQNF